MEWAANNARFPLALPTVHHHDPASHRGARSFYSPGGDVTDASTPRPSLRCVPCAKGNTAVKRAAGRSQRWTGKEAARPLGAAGCSN